MRRLADICNRKPLTLPSTCSVRDACRHMQNHRVGAVLVTDEEGRLVGIFTGRDVVTRVMAPGKSSKRTKVGDVMTPQPTAMSPQKAAIEALRLMWDGGFRHLPLVEDGKLVGVVSRNDFMAEERKRLEEERDLWEHIR